MSAIVEFDIIEVELNKELALKYFYEMDDELEMSEDFYREASTALYNRILRNEEVHLSSNEADFIKLKLPTIVKYIKYYE